MEALGRFLFEKELRRTMNKKYIDRSFNKFKNDIADIELNPQLRDSYALSDENGTPITTPAFKWTESMAEDLLEVCKHVKIDINSEY